VGISRKTDRRSGRHALLAFFLMVEGAPTTVCTSDLNVLMKDPSLGIRVWLMVNRFIADQSRARCCECALVFSLVSLKNPE